MRFEWLSGPDAASPELIHQDSVSGDSIAVVFTGAELTEFVTDPELHGELADWLPWDPAGQAELPETAYLNVGDYEALVIYGAPPSIDVSPANDEAGHALGAFFYGSAAGALAAYQDSLVPLTLGSDDANLLESLGDDGLHGAAVPDGLGALAGPAAEAGGEGTTFVLTDLDIVDLIVDYDHAQVPGLGGGDAAFLDHYLAADPPATDPFGTGAITIEIDDGSATTNTHILA